MSLSDDAYRHWEIYGYDPYNEEHWHYSQEQAQLQEVWIYQQLIDELRDGLAECFALLEENMQSTNRLYLDMMQGEVEL